MAKTLWFLKSAFILNEFLVSLKVSWLSCLCTPKLACSQGNILHLKMGHRSHYLCWLSRLLCCWRTAFSWCCLAYPWRWDRCLSLPVDNQGCAGGGKTQGNKFGCWARALCLWLTFRVLTDRQTDRVYLSSCFICLFQFSSWGVLGRGCSPVLFGVLCQFVCGADSEQQFSLNRLWLYCSNKKGTQRRQQLCREAVP